MTKRSRLVQGGGLVVGGALLAGARRYRRWKQEQRRRLRAASRLLATSRGTVEYRLEGTGPVLLVLHGSPGGYDQGIAVAQALQLRGYSLLAISRPGYRRTPLSSGRTPEAQADLCASALEALHISQVWLLAISGGGPAALHFALRYPRRCRGVLMVSALAQRYSEAAMYRALPLGQRIRQRLFDRLLFWDPGVYLLVVLSRYLPSEASAIPFLESCALNPLHGAGYRNDMRQFAALPPVSYADITTPMLIVHGTADRAVPFSQAQALARAVPTAQLVPVAGAHHLSVLGSDQAITAIQRFLQHPSPGDDAALAAR